MLWRLAQGTRGGADVAQPCTEAEVLQITTTFKDGVAQVFFEVSLSTVGDVVLVGAAAVVKESWDR